MKMYPIYVNCCPLTLRVLLKLGLGLVTIPTTRSCTHMHTKKVKGHGLTWWMKSQIIILVRILHSCLKYQRVAEDLIAHLIRVIVDR